MGCLPSKFLKKRQQWLDEVSHDEVLQQFTKVIRNGNMDRGPVLSKFHYEDDVDLFYRKFQLDSDKADEGRGGMKGSRTHGKQGQHEEVQLALDSLLLENLQRRPAPTHRTVEIFNKLILHHASFPFPSKFPVQLTSDAILRAVALLSGRTQRLFTDSTTMAGGHHGQGPTVLSRARSDTDMRRLIFQSLAIKAEHVTKIKQKKRKTIGFEVTAQDGDEFASAEIVHELSVDDDGYGDPDDDILDVLVEIQPRLHPTLMALPRDRLRHTAHRLGDPRPDLNGLKIPADDFMALIHLLLDLQLRGVDLKGFRSSLGQAEVDEFEAVTHSLLLSCGTKELKDVRWEAFNQIIHKRMPYLFEGLKDLLLSALHRERSSGKSIGLRPLAQSNILTLPILGHLTSFIPHLKDDLRDKSFSLVFSKLTDDDAKLDTLIAALKSSPSCDTRLILISGTLLDHPSSNQNQSVTSAPSGRQTCTDDLKLQSSTSATSSPLTIGIYNPMSWMPFAEAASRESPPDGYNKFPDMCFPFQLSPRHNVYYNSATDTQDLGYYLMDNVSGPAKAGQGQQNEGLCFTRNHDREQSAGESSFGRMIIDEGLGFGSITRRQERSIDEESEEVGQAGDKRHYWQEKYVIQYLEVWAWG